MILFMKKKKIYLEKAKYLAEYLTYSLSCCFVDDIGPVKVSVGIANYPQCAKDQEKLLILAEQAMYISQSKGYKDGMSAIISSSDFNFWDDMALKSFAYVVTKRHAQLGINFEEELLQKFNNEDIKTEKNINISVEGHTLNLNNLNFPKDNLPTKIKIYKCVNWNNKNLLNEDIIPDTMQKRNKSEANNILI